MKRLIPVIAAVIISVAYLISSWSGRQYTQADIKRVQEIPAQLTSVNKEGLRPNRYINAFVLKVVDGDTIGVTYKENTYKVRLLCIDTPESVKPGTGVQPYAKEATEYAKDLLLNQPVKLVFEKELKDRYGRLLAHVFLDNGEYVNALLVRNGFARVQIVSPNSTLSSYFHRLQEEAIGDSQGFWRMPASERPFIKNSDGKYVVKEHQK